MARFYGGGTVFPFGRFGNVEPGTVPLVPGAAVVPPEALPVGGVVAAASEGFPPFMIRPEVAGAYPQKQIVPPLFDQQTAASLLRNTWVGTPDEAPVTPPGARPIAAPSPVRQIFTTATSNAVQKAVSSDYRAANAAATYNAAQRRADATAHAAQRAYERAQVDLTPTAQGEALATAEAAGRADREAQRAARRADEEQRKAARDSVRAQAVQDASVAAEAVRRRRAAGAVDAADETALREADDTWYIGEPPPAEVAMPYVSAGPPQAVIVAPPIARVAVGAVGGFLFAGPVGALLGAVGGFLTAR
jgi:hypothetical protein